MLHVFQKKQTWHEEAFAPILIGTKATEKLLFLAPCFWIQLNLDLNEGRPLLNTVSWSIPKYCCTGHQFYLEFNKWGEQKCHGISTSKESFIADLIKPNDRCNGYSRWTWMSSLYVSAYLRVRGPVQIRGLSFPDLGWNCSNLPQPSPNDASISGPWPRIRFFRLVTWVPDWGETTSPRAAGGFGGWPGGGSGWPKGRMVDASVKAAWMVGSPFAARWRRRKWVNSHYICQGPG